MVHFDDWIYGSDNIPVPMWQRQMEKKWNPDKDFHDMAAQETSNVNKEVFAVKGLEARIKAPNNNNINNDLEQLANYKKDLDLEVGFKSPSEI